MEFNSEEIRADIKTLKEKLENRRQAILRLDKQTHEIIQIINKLEQLLDEI